MQKLNAIFCNPLCLESLTPTK